MGPGSKARHNVPPDDLTSCCAIHRNTFRVKEYILGVLKVAADEAVEDGTLHSTLLTPGGNRIFSRKIETQEHVIYFHSV